MKMLPRYVIRAASQLTHIEEATIAGSSKMHFVTEIRQACYWAAHELGLGVAQFARAVGRNHTTISKTLKHKTPTQAQTELVAQIVMRAKEIMEDAHYRAVRESADKLVA